MPTIHLHQKPRKKSSLIIGAMFLGVLLIYTYFISPDNALKIAPFFLMLFGGLFYLGSFIFNNPKRGLLLSSGIAFWLILHLMGLTHWIYILLIMTLLITQDIYFRKK